MISTDQIQNITHELAALERLEPAKRLDHIKTRVLETGGTWDLPSADGASYDPIVKTIQLHGIHAMAEKLDELAKNWMRAARNTIDGFNEDAVRASQVSARPSSDCAPDLRTEHSLLGAAR